MFNYTATCILKRDLKYQFFIFNCTIDYFCNLLVFHTILICSFGYFKWKIAWKLQLRNRFSGIAKRTPTNSSFFETFETQFRIVCLDSPAIDHHWAPLSASAAADNHSSSSLSVELLMWSDVPTGWPFAGGWGRSGVENDPETAADWLYSTCECVLGEWKMMVGWWNNKPLRVVHLLTSWLLLFRKPNAIRFWL